MRCCSLLLLVLLTALPTGRAAALEAGAAEGSLDFPIGAPLAGYLGRWLLFGFETADARPLIFASQFAPSTAVHTRPVVKAVAITAGGETVVLAKTDLIFADEALLRAVEDQAGAASGEALRGRILLSTSHSHNAPGRFTRNTLLMAGADRYDEDQFRRYAASIAEVVVRALAARQPAALGMAADPGFDPLGEDAIFRDRRSENDHLTPEGGFFFEADGITVDLDAPGARGPGKDPNLTLLRIDDREGRPLAIVVHYGIHGTALGAGTFPLDGSGVDDPHLWVSGDAATAVEWRLQESFTHPVVVMHLQGAGGDVSPAGDDLGHRRFARLELLGERASVRARALWQRTPTATTGVGLRVATRQIAQDIDAVRVERGGAVDWRYPPNPAGVYDGDVLTFEDFAFPVSAALCGGSLLDFGGGLVVDLTPEQRAQVDRDPASPTFGRGLVYGSCTGLDDSLLVVLGPALDPTFTPFVDVPLSESLTSLVTAVVIDGAPFADAEGSVANGPVLVAGAPGEPTTPWSERFVQRAREELGAERAFVVGYAQDHEGYLLLPEDWLSGGSTEVQINLWGPLQGEYLLERTLDLARDLLAGPLDPDPGPLDPPPDVVPHEPVPPRETPDAGVVLEQPAPVVSRLQTAEFAWVGGDPGIDLPRVVLERWTAFGWREVRLPSGRVLDDTGPQIAVAYRPEPIDATAEEIERDRYRASFQVVRDGPNLHAAAGFRRGVHRFRVEGERFAGGATVPYELLSETFRVRATDDLEIVDLVPTGFLLRGRVQRPAAEGYRLLSTTTGPGDPIPVAGAWVWRPGSWFGLARTGAEGRFTMLNLGGGPKLITFDRFFNRGSVVLAE